MPVHGAWVPQVPPRYRGLPAADDITPELLGPERWTTRSSPPGGVPTCFPRHEGCSRLCLRSFVCVRYSFLSLLAYFVYSVYMVFVPATSTAVSWCVHQPPSNTRTSRSRVVLFHRLHLWSCSDPTALQLSPHE